MSSAAVMIGALMVNNESKMKIHAAEFAKSVDPDEAAQKEPSHPGPSCSKHC